MENQFIETEKTSDLSNGKKKTSRKQINKRKLCTALVNLQQTKNDLNLELTKIKNKEIDLASMDELQERIDEIWRI